MLGWREGGGGGGGGGEDAGDGVRWRWLIGWGRPRGEQPKGRNEEEEDPTGGREAVAIKSLLL